MKGEQFWSGDKVMTIEDHEGIQSGTIGSVVSRWRGFAYVIRLPDGTFEWLNASEFSSIGPDRHYLRPGDLGVVTSIRYKRSFAKVGDVFQVVKVVEDVDYYEVLFDDKLRLFGGFRLARYLPPPKNQSDL